MGLDHSDVSASLVYVTPLIAQRSLKVVTTNRVRGPRSPSFRSSLNPTDDRIFGLFSPSSTETFDDLGPQVFIEVLDV